MWQVIKTELRYTGLMTSFVAGLIIPAVVLYLQATESRNISVVLLPLVVAASLNPFVFRSLERRERQQILLPVSIARLGIARLFSFLVPAVVVYSSYLILYQLFKHDPLWQEDMFDLAMFFGLILLGFSAFLIVRDISINWFEKYRAAEFDVVLLITVVSVILLAIPLILTQVHGHASDILRIACLVSGVLSLYPAVTSFTRRRSFLD